MVGSQEVLGIGARLPHGGDQPFLHVLGDRVMGGNQRGKNRAKNDPENHDQAKNRTLVFHQLPQDLPPAGGPSVFGHEIQRFGRSLANIH
jgi:hypothetical protein